MFVNWSVQAASTLRSIYGLRDRFLLWDSNILCIMLLIDDHQGPQLYIHCHLYGRDAIFPIFIRSVLDYFLFIFFFVLFFVLTPSANEEPNKVLNSTIKETRNANNKKGKIYRQSIQNQDIK